jgi:Bacterial PH domain
VGVAVASGAALWAFVFAILAAQAVVGASPEFKTFLGWALMTLFILVGFAFTNWAYGLFSLAYIIDRQDLTIRWGFREVVVPLDSILRMVPGRTLDVARVRGLNWWGCHVGHADVKRVGYTLFYSTHNTPTELLFIHTTEESYALTVIDQARFAEEVQSRATMGALESHPQRSAATGLAAFPFLRDQHALLAAGLTVVATVLLCGFVFARYPALPDIVELNFPALGGIVRIGDKQELLKIAYAGAAIMALNLVLGMAVHARERAAGLWLIASGGLIQVILLTAALIAFGRA